MEGGRDNRRIGRDKDTKREERLEEGAKKQNIGGKERAKKVKKEEHRRKVRRGGKTGG